MVFNIPGKEGSSQAGATQRDRAEFAEARVDIRKLCQFLASQQFNPTKVICSK